MTGAVSEATRQIVRQAGGRSTFADTVRTHLLRRPVRAFCALTLLYVFACGCLSHLKLLWLDELITLHIARLSSMGAIWAALVAGADPNPPITHILVHASRSVFGEREWALRLPAICGYWLGMLCLFAYLRRRLPGDWAMAGTVLSMTMAAFDYSFESRSYAIFYGLAMAAFYCWTVAADKNSRPQTRAAAIAGMALALMAGISTNYFAVLAFLPIAAGELARTITAVRQPKRRARSAVDLSLWVAIVVSVLPLLAYRTMIAHSIAQFAPHAWNKVSIDRIADSYTEMVETMLYPLLALFVLYGALRLVVGLRTSRELRLRPRFLAEITDRLRDGRALLPVHEAVGVFCLMAYPFLGYAAASIRGGMLSPRFVIPVCFGFAIAGSVMAYRLFGHLRLAAVAILCFCLAWFAARESVVGYWYAEQKQCFYKVVNDIPFADAYLPGRGPIVVPDPLMALTLQHYASPAIASRLVFPLDFPAVQKFRRDDSAEQNIWAGRNTMYTLPVMPLATFQQANGQYLVLASDGNWLLQDLDRHHYPEHRLPIDTRAQAIGGFTPLMHGTPAFYIGSGVLVPADPRNAPMPFKLSDNLPDAPDLE